MPAIGIGTLTKCCSLVWDNLGFCNAAVLINILPTTAENPECYEHAMFREFWEWCSFWPGAPATTVNKSSCKSEAEGTPFSEFPQKTAKGVYRPTRAYRETPLISGRLPVVTRNCDHYPGQKSLILQVLFGSLKYTAIKMKAFQIPPSTNPSPHTHYKCTRQRQGQMK